MRLSFLFALCLSLASSSVFAETKVAASDSVRYTSAASEHHSYGGGSMAVGVADTMTITSGGETLTGLYSLEDNWLQAYVGVFQTKANFDFSVGGAYKFTFNGTRATGFHVGPGFTVGGFGGDIAWSAFAALGGHFTFAEHFFVSVDGGPMITHTANNTNFRLRGFGPYLGLTIAYVFQ